MKRLLADNTCPRGTLNTDKFATALLMYRNTPIRDLGLSPAQVLFARRLRDGVPNLRSSFEMRKEWVIMKDQREKAFKKRHLLDFERWSRQTKVLPPLRVGQNVMVQNQVGAKSKKWEMSGKIVEDLGHGSYNVKIDGSNRVSKRQRQFLKIIYPFSTRSERSENGTKDVITKEGTIDLDDDISNENKGQPFSSSQMRASKRLAAKKVTPPKVAPQQSVSGSDRGR